MEGKKMEEDGVKNEMIQSGMECPKGKTCKKKDKKNSALMIPHTHTHTHTHSRQHIKMSLSGQSHKKIYFWAKPIKLTYL